MLFLYRVCTYDLLLHDSPKCHVSKLSHTFDPECACNVSHVLLCAQCIDGELCVVFCLQIAEFTQIVLFYVFICNVH